MDDLTRIKGIGAATAKKLGTAGLGTFAALAAVTDLSTLKDISSGDEQSRAWIGEAAKLQAAAETTATSPSPTGVTPPAAEPPRKETTITATAPVTETVDASVTPDGEVRSAELRAETVRPVDPAVTAALRERRARRDYAGSLPATSRVLPDGEEVELGSANEDGQERRFTASVRIMRSKKLYEPGAPVPLTYREFVVKRDGRSIVETDWADGLEIA
ncbi:helix-hairpin-helix domain-containing protein [Notoacmeibacter ruber]|uniref:Helix-hairpin-helix domain-containing protein n=1 Tax=Notoacmeibacter ruber TaxID=2670375 RepID=A0A3L7JEK7_9HYPH|nr:helix-hairpin-helix domain-containing protein [Notoacmeibacter ruber]RLQ88910.1 hypothetical protein D8780_12415 [Notoacmeibacter ruber]